MASASSKRLEKSPLRGIPYLQKLEVKVINLVEFHVQKLWGNLSYRSFSRLLFPDWSTMT